MADSIGSILVYDEEKCQFAMSKQQFQEHYYEYMMDLVNDSDQMVKIQALISSAKLMSNGYFEIEQIQNEIFPVFIKLFDQIQDNEDGLHLLTKMLGNFVYEVAKFDSEFIQSNAEQICKFFDSCVKSEDAVTRYNCAYNLPCIFDIFADFSL